MLSFVFLQPIGGILRFQVPCHTRLVPIPIFFTIGHQSFYKRVMLICVFMASDSDEEDFVGFEAEDVERARLLLGEMSDESDISVSSSSSSESESDESED